MKLKWKNKVVSGALQFTIFISVLIALLLAGIILLTYTHRYFIEQSKAIVDNIQLANTGMAALRNQNAVSSDTVFLKLPDSREEQTIKVHLSHWGLFEKGYVVAIHRQKKFIKCSLLGTSLNTTDRPVIYLQENYIPLAVVGNTQIKGKAILPQQGVAPGNISGNSYYGTQLIYGPIESSGAELPKTKYDCVQQINYYVKDYLPSSTISLEKGKRLINSFKESEKGYFSEHTIVLDDIALTGNIIIRSDEKIIVKRSAVLKDIILAAPIIIIEDAVSGNFQALADTSIQIGKDCILLYPTALAINEKEEINPDKPYDKFTNKIFIDSNSVIRGSICYFKPRREENDFRTNIFIDEQSSVKGEVYCLGNFELKGKVSGSVFTNYFLANEAGSVFVNHIYNAGISTENFPENFGGLLLENEQKTVVKWLY